MSRMLRDYAYQGTKEENQQLHSDPQDALPPTHKELLQEITTATQFMVAANTTSHQRHHPSTTPSSLHNSGGEIHNNNKQNRKGSPKRSSSSKTKAAQTPQPHQNQNQHQQSSHNNTFSSMNSNAHVINAHHSPVNPLRHAKKKKDHPAFIETVIATQNPTPLSPAVGEHQEASSSSSPIRDPFAQTKRFNSVSAQQDESGSPPMSPASLKKKSAVKFSVDGEKNSNNNNTRKDSSAFGSLVSPESSFRMNSKDRQQQQESSPQRCTALRQELYATLYDAAKDPASETAPSMLLTSLNRVLELLKSHDGSYNRERVFAASSADKNKKTNNTNNQAKSSAGAEDDDDDTYTPHRCSVCGGSSAALRNALGMTTLEHSPTLTNSVAVERFFDIATPVPDEVFSLLRAVFARVSKQRNLIVAETWMKILEYLFLFPAVIQRVLGHAEALSIAFRPTAASQSSLARSNRLKLNSLFASDSDEEDESAASKSANSKNRHKTAAAGAGGSDDDEDNQQNVGSLPRIETKKEYLTLVRHVARTLCRSGLVDFLTQFIRDISSLSNQGASISAVSDVSDDAKVRLAYMIRICSLCEEFFVEHDPERTQTMMKIIMEYHHHPLSQHQQQSFTSSILPSITLQYDSSSSPSSNNNNPTIVENQHRHLAAHYNYSTTMELESILKNNLPAPSCSLRGVCIDWISSRLRYSKTPLIHSVEMRCLFAALGVSVSTLSSIYSHPLAGFNPVLNHQDQKLQEDGGEDDQNQFNNNDNNNNFNAHRHRHSSVVSNNSHQQGLTNMNHRRRSRNQSVVAEILMRSQTLPQIQNSAGMATMAETLDPKAFRDTMEESFMSASRNHQQSMMAKSATSNSMSVNNNFVNQHSGHTPDNSDKQLSNGSFAQEDSMFSNNFSFGNNNNDQQNSTSLVVGRGVVQTNGNGNKSSNNNNNNHHSKDELIDTHPLIQHLKKIEQQMTKSKNEAGRQSKQYSQHQQHLSHQVASTEQWNFGGIPAHPQLAPSLRFSDHEQSQHDLLLLSSFLIRYIKNFVNNFQYTTSADQAHNVGVMTEEDGALERRKSTARINQVLHGNRRQRSQTMKHFSEQTRLLSLAEAKFLYRVCFSFNHVLSLIHVPSSGSMIGATSIPASAFAPLIQLTSLLCDQFHLLRKRNKIRRDRALEMELLEKNLWKEAEEEARRNKELPPPPPIPKTIPNEIQPEDECVNRTISCAVSCAARLIPRPGPTGQFWESAEPLSEIYNQEKSNNNNNNSQNENDNNNKKSNKNDANSINKGDDTNKNNGADSNDSTSNNSNNISSNKGTSNKSSDKNFRSTVFSNLTQLVLRGNWAVIRLLPFCPLDAGDLSRLLAALTEEVPWFPNDTNVLSEFNAKNVADLVSDRSLMTPPPRSENKISNETMNNNSNTPRQQVIHNNTVINLDKNDNNNNNNSSQQQSATSLGGNSSNKNHNNLNNSLHGSDDDDEEQARQNSNMDENPWATPNVKQLSVTPLLLSSKDTSNQYLLGWQFFCFCGPLKRYSACFSSWTDIETRNMSNQYVTSLRHVFNTAQDALKICETCLSLATKMERETERRERKRLGFKDSAKNNFSSPSADNDNDNDHTTVDYSLSAVSYYTQQQSKDAGKTLSAVAIITEMVAEHSTSATMIGIMFSLQKEKRSNSNNTTNDDDKKNSKEEASPSSDSTNNNIKKASSTTKLSKEVGGKIINELVSNGLVDIALAVLSLVEKWVAVMESSRNKTLSDQLHQQTIRNEMKKMMRDILRMHKLHKSGSSGAYNAAMTAEETEAEAFERKEEEEEEEKKKKNAGNNPFQSKTIPWFQTESQKIFGLSVRLLSEVAEFSSEARKRILEHKIFSGSLQQLTDRVCATNVLATKKLDDQINDKTMIMITSHEHNNNSATVINPTTNSGGAAVGSPSFLNVSGNNKNPGLQKKMDSFLMKFAAHEQLKAEQQPSGSTSPQNDLSANASSSNYPNTNSNNNTTGTTTQNQLPSPSNFLDTGAGTGTDRDLLNFSAYENNASTSNAVVVGPNNGVSDDGQDVLDHTAVLQLLQVRRGYSSGLTGIALQRALNSGGMLDRLKLLCEVAPHLANIASSIQQQEEEARVHSKSGDSSKNDNNNHHQDQVGFYQTPFFANSVFAVCCLVLHGLPILNPEDPLQDPPLLLQAHEALESVLKALISLCPDPEVVASIKKKRKTLISNAHHQKSDNDNNNSSSTATKKKPVKNPDQEQEIMLQSRVTMSLLPIFKLRLLRFQPWYKDLQVLVCQLIWKALQTDPDSALCNIQTFPHPDDDSTVAESDRKKRASLKNFQKHVKLVHRMKKMESDRVEQALLIERCLVQFIQLVERETASRAAVHRRDAAARRRYMVLNEQRAQLDRYLSVDRRGEYLFSEYDDFCKIERLALENLERIARAKNVVPFEITERSLMAQRRDFFLYEYQHRIQHVYGPESVAWNATKREMMIGLAIVRKMYGKMTDIQQQEFNNRNALIAQQKTRFEKNIAPLWARAVIEATETRTRRIEYEEKWFEGFNKIRREYFSNSLRVFQRYETHCRNKISREFSISLKKEIESQFELLALQAEEDSDRLIMTRLFNAVFYEIAQGWLRIRADWLSVCEKAAREQILIEASEATYGPKHWVLPTLRCAAQESTHRVALANSEAKERAAFTRAWVWAMQLAVLDEERSVRRNLMVQWAWQLNSLAFQRNRGLFEAEETLRRRMEERAYHDELCLIRSAAKTSSDTFKGQLQLLIEHQQGAHAISSEEGWLRTGLITLVKERILALKKILREYEKVAAITAKILADGGEVAPAPTPAQQAAALAAKGGGGNTNTNENLASSTRRELSPASSAKDTTTSASSPGKSPRGRSSTTASSRDNKNASPAASSSRSGRKNSLNTSAVDPPKNDTTPKKDGDAAATTPKESSSAKPKTPTNASSARKTTPSSASPITKRTPSSDKTKAGSGSVAAASTSSPPATSSSRAASSSKKK